MNDYLVETLKDLLNDEENTYTQVLAEAEDQENDVDIDSNVKAGASEMPPAGHKFVYVFCVNSKDLAGEVIVKVTRKVFNKSAAAAHVALSFDKSLTKMYSFVVGQNFRVENLHVTYKPDATFSLYKIAVPNDVYTAMQDAVKNIEQTRDQYTYNLRGIAGFFFKKHQDKFNTKEKALFCSQFVARMFATAGMPVFAKEDYKVQPYEFAKNKKFKFCYRGKVKHFQPSRVR